MKPSKPNGHSLVEVLTVLTIAVICLTWTLPSLQDAKSKRQVTGASEQLVDFISSANGLAVKLNRKVSVSLIQTSQSDWCVGMVAEKPACDCTIQDESDSGYCSIGGTPQILSSKDLDLAAMTDRSEDASITFDEIRGTLVAKDIGQPHFFDLASNNGKYGLRVRVSPTGRAFVCNWLTTNDVPGYRVCEPVGGDAAETVDGGNLKI